MFAYHLFQEEELDEHNVQVTPPGFHVIFLPFAEDMRKLKFAEQPRGNFSIKDDATLAILVKIVFVVTWKLIR